MHTSYYDLFFYFSRLSFVFFIPPTDPPYPHYPITRFYSQTTTSFGGAETTLEAKGRHDPCVVPRAVAIVEAMAALVLADACLHQEAREASAKNYAYIGRAHPMKQ